MNLKKKLVILFIIFVGFFSVLSSQVQKEKFSFLRSSMLSFSGVALAEDDDDEKHDEDEDDDEEDEHSSAQEETSTKDKPQTYTQVIKLPDQIVTKTIIEDVILPDTDKDGIADANDPHPTIPEHIIVSDANGNGIDDNYEISLEDINGNGIADNYEKIN